MQCFRLMVTTSLVKMKPLCLGLRGGQVTQGPVLGGPLPAKGKAILGNWTLNTGAEVSPTVSQPIPTPETQQSPEDQPR